MVVKQRVHWPHETILGGINQQRVNYDQLSLTQWIHGFTKNILEEKSAAHRDIMIACLGNLTEAPQISHGKELTQLMPSCSARWSEV